jgi:Domain of Unknown Function (DUF928)
MNKLPQLSIRFALAMTVLIANPASLRSETNQQNSSDPPAAPSTGTPSGNPTPGTTRPEATCPKTNKPLTALIANNGSDYTDSEYPTFWFYVPYDPNQISKIEFLLLNGKERQTIYRTAIRLADKSGIIKITIPSQPQYALKIDEDYRWYLLLDCNPDRSDEPDRVVDGWVQRKPTNSQQALWYDRITDLAEQYAANPENRELQADWANLLESMGYGWVVPEPFVSSELLPPSD